MGAVQKSTVRATARPGARRLRLTAAVHSGRIAVPVTSLFQTLCGFFLLALLLLAVWDVLRCTATLLAGLVLFLVGHALKLTASLLRKITGRSAQGGPDSQ